MKVVLLGDSIRMIGYGTRVPTLLGDEFNVWQPAENCRFSKYTLWGVSSSWCKEMEGAEIVHWNNGLWDSFNHGDGLFSSEDEYLSNMCRIADLLLEKHPRIIFATTTPVTEQHPNIQNADIIRLNNLIVPVLKDKGIIINDLHRLVATDVDRYIRKDDNIHLTQAGIDACAEKVADKIRAVAETL